MAPVLLKRWSPLFDLEREPIGVGPLWVRLPGLPLHFWYEDIFTRIRNVLDTFLYYDETYIILGNRSMAHILVYLDTKEGLEEKITLQWKNFTSIQILDYEGDSFRCQRCHKVGHIYKECPLICSAATPTKDAKDATPDAPTSAVG